MLDDGAGKGSVVCMLVNCEGMYGLHSTSGAYVWSVDDLRRVACAFERVGSGIKQQHTF